MTITHTIERDENEFDVECEIKIWPATSGHCDRYGAKESPDEPEEAEILSISPDVELTESEIDAITEKALQQYADESNYDGE